MLQLQWEEAVAGSAAPAVGTEKVRKDAGYNPGSSVYCDELLKTLHLIFSFSVKGE